MVTATQRELQQRQEQRRLQGVEELDACLIEQSTNIMGASTIGTSAAALQLLKHEKELKKIQIMVLNISTRILGRDNNNSTNHQGGSNGQTATPADTEMGQYTNDRNSEALVVDMERIQSILDDIARKYESTTTKMRNQLDLQWNEIEQHERKHILNEKESQSLKQLVATLEEEATASSSVEQSRDNFLSSTTSVTEREGGQQDKTASLLANVLLQSSKPKVVSSPSSPLPPSSLSTASMVSVLTAQRDRYRTRVQDLEQQIMVTGLTVA